MFEINGLFESCVIAIDHSASGSTALCFQQIAAVNSFTVAAIAVLARWLKRDAEETRVRRLTAVVFFDRWRVFPATAVCVGLTSLFEVPRKRPEK